MLIMDGNQYMFKDLPHAGSKSAAESTRALIAQVVEHCKERHKSDLPEATSVMIHVMVDLARLQEDLLASDTLSNVEQLTEFFHALTKSYPLLTVTDCGRGREGVDNKLKGIYTSTLMSYD